MRGPFTVTTDCTACGACLRTCPERCLRPTPGGETPLVVLAERCTGCGECAEVCPAEAILPLAEAKGEHRYHGGEHRTIGVVSEAVL